MPAYNFLETCKTAVVAVVCTNMALDTQTRIRGEANIYRNV